MCQQTKAHHLNHPELNPISSSRPFQIITADIMGPLPKSSKQNTHALVIIDHFTKWSEIFPLRSTTTEKIAEKILKYIYQHGIPDQIITDQGTNLQAELLNEIYDMLDIHKTRTSPYNPRADGQSEKFVQTIKQMISAYVEENHKNWDEKLDALSFAYNTSTHGSTKYSPFYLVYGRYPKIPLDLFKQSTNMDTTITVDGFCKKQEEILKDAFQQVIKNREHKMDKEKIRHERQVRKERYEINDLVWLRNTQGKKNTSKKLNKKWIGPYRITKNLNNVNYEIKLNGKRSRKFIVNIQRLKKCFMRVKEDEKAEDLNKHEVRTKSKLNVANKIKRKYERFRTNKTNKAIPVVQDSNNNANNIHEISQNVNNNRDVNNHEPRRSTRLKEKNERLKSNQI